MSVKPWILGINASHNGAACLLRGSDIAVAIQEERLVGVKRARVVGSQKCASIPYCFQVAGISAADLDAVVICVQGQGSEPVQDVRRNPDLVGLSDQVQVSRISHHLAHAIGAYASSGFNEAVILVVDGVGSPIIDLPESERALVHDSTADHWETASMYVAEGCQLKPVYKDTVLDNQWYVERDHGMPGFGSLGGMYSAVSKQVFGTPEEAGKVMALASFASPDIPASEFFSISNDRFAFSDVVTQRFPQLCRLSDDAKSAQVLSSSVQHALEQGLLWLCEKLAMFSNSKNFCYSGGVTLNSVANEKIVRSKLFQQHYFMPASEDCGTAIGAAFSALWSMTKVNQPKYIDTDFFGRNYPVDEFVRSIDLYPKVNVRPSQNLVTDTVDLLCQGVPLGWYQGGSEFGPRALGHRSILCDPRDPSAKDTVNAKVKYREAFRPFAPITRLEDAPEWFRVTKNAHDSPFMLRIVDFKPGREQKVPAVSHVDGTARYQTVTAITHPLLSQVLEEFKRRTGVPILMNTSFNIRNEPIVETPLDAFFSVMGSGMRHLIIGSYIIEIADDFSVLDLEYRGNFEVLSREEPHALVVDTPWGPVTQNTPPWVLEFLNTVTKTQPRRNLEDFAAILGNPPDLSLVVTQTLVWLKRMRLINVAGIDETKLFFA